MTLSCFSYYVNCVNRHLGQAVAWLALAMVVVMFFNVVGRYALNTTLVWQQELVRFMHAILFLSVSGYTLLENKHVRVDVFYQRFSNKTQALIDMVGTVIFLFPFCVAILYFSFGYVVSSWHILEASPEYNGMKGVFILKTFIWLFAISFMLQGISVICTSLATLKEA